MSEPDTRSPEQRIFRRIFQGIYAVLLLGFFGTIAVSATYGAFHTPEPVGLPDGPDHSTATTCSDRMSRLFDELEHTGQSMLTRSQHESTTSEWKAFSDSFRARLLATGSVCNAEGSPHAGLVDDLERHRVGYETALRGLSQVAGAARGRLVEALRPAAEGAADAP